MPSAGIETLSAREEQVLALAADGLLDKQIALSLAISENTLRTYWKRIRSKVGDSPRSALAARFAQAKMAERKEDGDWTFDVQRGVFEYLGDLPGLPQGKSTLEQVLLAFHPDERERLRELFRSMTRDDAPRMSVCSRLTTDYGYESIISQIDVIRDDEGRVERLIGHSTPMLNLTAGLDRKVVFGHYRRDLNTGEIELDDGYRLIFRLDGTEQDLRAALVQRYCPSSREKMRDLVDAMVAGGEWRRRLHARLCFEDGEEVWVTLQNRIELEDGRPKAFALTIAAYL